jgi:UDP-glucose 4-epimerase
LAKAFLTGGAGFVGSHVCQLLLDRGHDVAIFDQFVNYIYPLDRVHVDNLTQRMAGIKDRVTVFRGSTRDQDNLRRALQSFQPNYIVHLAAMPLANLAVEHPEEAVDAILAGTINVLHQARDLAALKRLVYVSSSMVYGDFVRVPVRENDPKDPKEVYGSLKLSGELLVRSFGRLYGIEYSIVRPSAVYGPTDNNRRVLGIFLERALQGKPLIVKGADQALDFTFVEDAAHGIVCATLHDGASGGTFNITRGQGRTISEAAQIVAKLVPQTEIRVEGADQRMPSRGTLDISLAREQIEFHPQVDLEEGLRRYHAYLTNQRERGVW